MPRSFNLVFNLLLLVALLPRLVYADSDVVGGAKTITHRSILNQSALDEFVAKARDKKIWLQPEWRVLMHFTPTSFGLKKSSLVDDPAFFLSNSGKESLQAELEATLLALFSSARDDNDSPACRFPARLAWLRKALGIDKTTLPERQCSHLNKWLRTLDADGLTLIFPVSVLNSPASMFGHTFLRLDRKAEKKPDLLAWAVNFAAHADQERGFSFAYNGVFGGYPGRFTLARYYQRVKAYSDIESRDIWEYQLNYSPGEVDFMLRHLWELLPVYFDYYFIDENCSYQLLALLEAARPSLSLTQGFNWGVTPADTVRALTKVPGLVEQVNYRPSLRQNVNARAEAIGFANQQIAKALATGEQKLSDDLFKSKPEREQVKILELAAEYQAYLEASSNKKQDVFDVADADESQREQRASRQYQLLAARSEITLELPPPSIKKPLYRPEQGHGGRRLGLHYGSDDSDQYLQFDFRWAYHDLYDPDSGFIKGAELEFLKPSIRFYPDDNNWKVEALDFVGIVSAPARNYFIRPFSWKASASLKRYDFDNDERPLLGDFKLGAGLSYQLGMYTQASIFADTQFLVGDEFDHDSALGFGASAEVIYTITNVWKGGVYTGAMQYVEGVSQTAYQFGGRLRLSVDQDSAALLELATKREFSGSFLQAQLSWQVYF